MERKQGSGTSGGGPRSRAEAHEAALDGPLAPLHAQEVGSGTREFRPAPPPDTVETEQQHLIKGAAPAPQPDAEPVGDPEGAVLPDAEGMLRFNGLVLDPASETVTVDGAAVELSSLEHALLESLLGSGRRVRSKADLVLAMRGQRYVSSYQVDDAVKRALEVCVADLREKLGGPEERYVESVPGVGYRLAPAAD